MTRAILFAEVPGFYAEVERAADPALAGRPVIVGGDPRKRGLVQSATEDALGVGVAVGMGVLEALRLCPNARCLRTNMRRYREMASRLRACLRRGMRRVEPFGLGAAYLDPGGPGEEVEQAAARLRQAVRRELDLPLRVGIAPVKFLARLAAEEAQSSGLRRVRADEVPAFLHPLPVSRLPGVGPNTAARLRGLGVETVGDLAALDPLALERTLGNHGLAIREAALGRGDTRVRAADRPRSLSQESTLTEPELDLGLLAERLGELCLGLEAALRLHLLAARRVSIKVRYDDHETTTRSRTLAHPVAAAAQVEGVARELLGRTQAGSRPVRLLGVAVTGLVPRGREDRQLELFPPRAG